MPRALFVVPVYCCAPNTGGGQRTLHLYQALAQFCSVDVLLVSEPQFAPLETLYPQVHREFFPEAAEIHLRRSPKPGPGQHGLLRRVLKMLRPPRRSYEPSPEALQHLDAMLARKRYDFIVGRYLKETSQSGVLARAPAPVWLDVDDRDDKVLETRLHSPTTPRLYKPLLRWRLARTRELVEQLLERCAHIWLASDVDRQEVRHRSKSVLPNVPYLKDAGERRGTEAAGTRSCIFVGTFVHRVNREGVLHFVQRCWPAIQRAVPGATFRVVGSGGWQAMQAELERHPGVQVVGAVPSMADEYRAAAFAVVPLFEGSGTKIKVLESLLFGRTLVAHAHAVRGLGELRHGQSLLVAQSDEDMVAHCVALFGDPQAARALAAHGREIVEREYSFDRFAQIVRDDVLGMLAPHADAALLTGR
ncbi:MAG TPA: glycosyltransferase [Albitalea sp.]|uniref:glycosyltransferase n=1 Tax=Piscinibacter sp. TaxID=1903157 RepID=UPI002ED5EF0C